MISAQMQRENRNVLETTRTIYYVRDIKEILRPEAVKSIYFFKFKKLSQLTPFCIGQRLFQRKSFLSLSFKNIRKGTLSLSR